MFVCVCKIHFNNKRLENTISDVFVQYSFCNSPGVISKNNIEIGCLRVTHIAEVGLSAEMCDKNPSRIRARCLLAVLSLSLLGYHVLGTILMNLS